MPEFRGYVNNKLEYTFPFDWVDEMSVYENQIEVIYMNYEDNIQGKIDIIYVDKISIK